jgi:hypothetical protein
LAVTFTTHAHQLNDSLIAALTGNVHFVRISMDGVGATYETLRGRSFTSFRQRFESVRKLAPFGITSSCNANTLPDLDAATALAAEIGASEFLLLPEQPVRGEGGIDERTALELRHWVAQYRGLVRLAVSEAGATGLPICNPLAAETGLQAYAHIDASGSLKRSSFDSVGVHIGLNGVMQALKTLGTIQTEKRQ